MEIIEWKFYIHLLDLTRNSCEKSNYRFLAGIEPAIPEQCSNQLSYRVLLSNSNHKFMYIYWGYSASCSLLGLINVYRISTL